MRETRTDGDQREALHAPLWKPHRFCLSEQAPRRYFDGFESGMFITSPATFDEPRFEEGVLEGAEIL